MNTRPDNFLGPGEGGVDPPGWGCSVGSIGVYIKISVLCTGKLGCQPPSKFGTHRAQTPTPLGGHTYMPTCVYVVPLAYFVLTAAVSPAA